jgi:plastocyanin
MAPLRICVAALAMLAMAATASAAATEPVPDRVQVRGSEFDLTLSKQKLRPGRAIVQFLNDGEDPHDLKLQRLGSSGVTEGPELSIGVVGPGEYENLDARLKKRSTYVFWCSLSDHRELGMEATLRTKKRRG